MNRPDSIPQAIWDAAIAVVQEIGESQEHDTLPIAMAMVAVVDAERQRCAGKARFWTDADGYQVRNVANEIVRAIESGR